MDMLMWLYIVMGIIGCVFAVPLAMGKIKRNRWYGFRTPTTMRSDAIWYPVNAYAGRWLIFFGIATVVAALVLRLVPGLSLDGYALSVTLVVVIALLICFVMTVRFMRTLPKS